MAAKSDNWNKSEMSPTWRPENPGDEIVGLLTEKQEGVGANNSKLYTIETKDKKELLSVWGSSVLDIRMAKVKVGQEVKIVFKGKAKSQKRAGAMYKDFDVFFRDASAEDYDSGLSTSVDDIFN